MCSAFGSARPSFVENDPRFLAPERKPAFIQDVLDWGEVVQHGVLKVQECAHLQGMVLIRALIREFYVLVQEHTKA